MRFQEDHADWVNIVFLARTTSVTWVMEVIYDSNVDPKPSSGTQCIIHSHAEPCRRVQAAPGTPAHTNPLRDVPVGYDMREELTTVTKHDFGHPLASAFIMQPSESEDGEGSSSSNLTSTNSFSLKRNTSTIGLIRHPIVSTHY
jgi:hypothetical protein